MKYNKELNLKDNIGMNEIVGNNLLVLVALESIVNVCINHMELGEEGKKKDIINQFGEQALRADLTAEMTVLEGLREYANRTGIIMEIHGEETGSTTLGSKGEKYFGVLDGLDGSVNYLNPGKWSYGTMLAIAKIDNPKYRDFEIAAIGFPEENWVLMAVKDSGVFIFDIDKQNCRKIEPIKDNGYDRTKVLSDNYFPEAKTMLGKMQEVWPRVGSEAAAILAIITGSQVVNPKYPKMNEGWLGLADVTRKGNLEQPAIYLILSELKGTVVDKEGKDIGDKNFRDWGQQEKIPIISARSAKVAEKILAELKL